MKNVIENKNLWSSGKLYEIRKKCIVTVSKENCLS